MSKLIALNKPFGVICQFSGDKNTLSDYIDIPKGIDDNEIITIINKGNRISDTNKGDVEIKILVKKHELFKRNGIDLIYKKSITLKESFCGFSFDLTYIDGKEFKINNKAGNIIPSDFRKVIPINGGIYRFEKNQFFSYFLFIRIKSFQG